MRLSQAHEVEFVADAAAGSLHRDEIGKRADRCLDAVDPLDVRAGKHVAERRGQQLLGQEIDEAVRRAQRHFSHQKLRSLVYAETSLARRRLLHRRIGAVLSKGAGAEEHAALVAKHLRLAGDDSAAALHYRVAAEHAARLLRTPTL